jgi:hypothetical protein
MVTQWKEEVEGIPGCVLPDEYDGYVCLSPISLSINPD